MHRFLTLPVVLMLCGAALAAAESPGPARGVSAELAQARRQAIASLTYDLHFSIPAERTSPVTGRNAITVTLLDAGHALVLDFAPDRGRVVSLTANDRGVDAAVADGHVVIPAAALRRGSN